MLAQTPNLVQHWEQAASKRPYFLFSKVICTLKDHAIYVHATECNKTKKATEGMQFQV